MLCWSVFPVHAPDQPFHCGGILLGRSDHDLVAGEFNTTYTTGVYMCFHPTFTVLPQYMGCFPHRKYTTSFDHCVCVCVCVCGSIVEPDNIVCAYEIA